MSRSETLRLPALGPASAAAPATPLAGSPVDAQLLGQPGVRRGLREGATALIRARTAYLSTEWSGGDDRRPEPGLLVRGRL